MNKKMEASDDENPVKLDTNEVQEASKLSKIEMQKVKKSKHCL